LIWQSLSGMIFLYRMLYFNSSYLMLMALLIKRGFPPFFSWITNLKWSWFPFILFLTFHKRLPLLILFTLWIDKLVFIIFVIYALILIYGSFSVFRIILLRRVVDSAWILLLPKINYFWLYTLLYSAIWIIWARKNYDYRNTKSNNRFNFLILLSFPPFIFFLFKLLLWNNVQFRFNLLLTVSSWIVLMNYINLNLLNFHRMVYLFKSNAGYLWPSTIIVAPLFLI
jgi:hypothetical protein